MKKLVALMMLIPLVSFGDMPGRRPAPMPRLALRRIGCEIFPEIGSSQSSLGTLSGRYGSAVMYLPFLLAFPIGIIVIKRLTKEGRHAVSGIAAGLVLVVVGATVVKFTYFRDACVNKELWWDTAHYDAPELGERADQVRKDLYDAVVALVKSWKVEALERYCGPLAEMELPEGIGRDEVINIVSFPDVLKPTLHDRLWDYHDRLSSYDSYWGVRHGGGFSKESKWSLDFPGEMHERDLKGDWTDFDILRGGDANVCYEAIRNWLKKVNASIPETWMPSHVKSDEDLIRECLVRSVDLRVRCLGVPIEHFGRFDFDLFRGWDDRDIKSRAEGRVRSFEVVQTLREESRRLKARGTIMSGDNGMVPYLAWQFPIGASASEKKEFAVKIGVVKDDLQRQFDSGYAKLNAAGKLKKIKMPSVEMPVHTINESRAAEAKNALTVVESVLEKSSQLRKLCDGVPVEWLAAAMKIPAPSIEDNSIKIAFRSWAMGQMPDGLNETERRIVFDWQFLVCEKEGRLWRKVFAERLQKQPRLIADYKVVRRSKERNGNTKNDAIDGFEDIAHNLTPSDYIVSWYEKALRCGYKAKDYDRMLMAKAKGPEKFSVNSSLCLYYPGEGEVTGTLAETRSAIAMSVGGDVGVDDLRLVAAYCRGLREEKHWLSDLGTIRFNACGNKVVEEVCDVFSGFRVDRVYVDFVGTYRKIWEKTDHLVRDKLDVSSLSKLKVKDISLSNICLTGRIYGDAEFPLKSIAINGCEICGSLVLDAQAGLDQLGFYDCKFSGPLQLEKINRIWELHIFEAESPVDLSFVKNLKTIRKLEVPGCRVLNADVLKGREDLEWLCIDHAADGVDWVEVVKSCPNIRFVDITKPTRMTCCAGKFGKEFTRDEVRRLTSIIMKRTVLITISGVDDRMKQAVLGDDLDEVRRLLRNGASAEGALRCAGFCCSVEMARLLLENWAEAKTDLKGTYIGGLMWSGCCKSNKDRDSVEMLKLLLEYGADPNDSRENPLDALMSYRGVNEVHLEMVKALLAHGANPKRMKDGLYNLCRGCDPKGTNRVEVLRVLLEKGCEREAVYAAWRGVVESCYESEDAAPMAALLFQYGIDVAEARKAFYKLGWNPELLTLYLSKGGDPNVRDSKGRLVLHDFFGSCAMMEKWRTCGLENILPCLKERGACIAEALKGVEQRSLIGTSHGFNLSAREKDLIRLWMSYGAELDGAVLDR